MQALLKATDVGRLLGLHPESVKVYARTGTLPGIKIGNRWRFHPSTVERFLSDRVDHQQHDQYDPEVVQFRSPRGRQQ
jgi:hypothetical protein